MPDVNGGQGGTRRARNALETRRRIRQAAEKLFLAQGYARTTITGIADRADVAVQTVYAVFGNKRSILKEVVEVAIAGDDLPVALADRDSFDAMFRTDEAEVMLQRFTAEAMNLFMRTTDVFEIAYTAASSDEAIAEVARQGDQGRLEDMAKVAEGIKRKGWLRGELTVAYAADVMWTLASPNLYRMLVVRRGWSPQQYRDWLLETLRSLFLDNDLKPN